MRSCYFFVIILKLKLINGGDLSKNSRFDGDSGVKTDFGVFLKIF